MKKDSFNIESKILDRHFIYEPPYFYNNEFALRCELGIGDSNEEYMDNAKCRMKNIFDILFKKGVDMIFFNNYIYDYDYDTSDKVCTHINQIISFERKKLKFCLEYQKNYAHKIVKCLPISNDDSEDEDICRINRICCYPNENFNAIEALNKQIDNQENATIHLVSFVNNCIFTVYDDRGCDIVFYDKNNFIKFYPLLEKYLLKYDLDLMKQRFNKAIE